jgi:hypothetical protein
MSAVQALANYSSIPPRPGTVLDMAITNPPPPRPAVYDTQLSRGNFVGPLNLIFGPRVKMRKHMPKTRSTRAGWIIPTLPNTLCYEKNTCEVLKQCWCPEMAKHVALHMFFRHFVFFAYAKLTPPREVESHATQPRVATIWRVKAQVAAGSKR